MFDKTFQKGKRRYQRKWPVDIDNFNANNPKKFWEELNKPGLWSRSKKPPTPTATPHFLNLDSSPHP